MPILRVTLPHVLPALPKYVPGAREAAAATAVREASARLGERMRTQNPEVGFDPSATEVSCYAKLEKDSTSNRAEIEAAAKIIAEQAIENIRARIDESGMLPDGGDAFRSLNEIRKGGKPPRSYKLSLQVEQEIMLILEPDGWWYSDGIAVKEVEAADYHAQVEWLRDMNLIP